MNKLEQAARQALEALETKGEHHSRVYEAITALREALAEQAEQEPVGYHVTAGRRVSDGMQVMFGDDEILYAAPVRTKDLTDDEIHEALHGKDTPPGLMNGIRAVIVADREKNK